ncbi:hypothetical protein ABIB25_001943 [Nakamurella sp. UYEF19]|uniref:HNH endonuclease signature motif containing protein n=1 Tax=Nakamurella sp. UYEF19 TaxID=1756392 RepID=UPI003399DB97
MEDNAFPDTQQTHDLLDIALRVVGQLRETQWWRIQHADLLTLGAQLQQLANEVYTANVNLTGELDSENIAAKYACTSTAALLRQKFNISPAEAYGRVNAARQVLPRESDSGTILPPVLPALAAAMAAGTVNSEHIKLVIATMSKLPALLPVQDLQFWESFLVDHATGLDPNPFEKVCRSVLDKADPDGDLDEETAAAKMEFSFGRRNLRTGLTPIKGQLDDYSVEVVKKAIDGLSAPHPSTPTSSGSGSGSGEGPGAGSDSGSETSSATATSTDAADADAEADADADADVESDGDSADGSDDDLDSDSDLVDGSDNANDNDVDVDGALSDADTSTENISTEDTSTDEDSLAEASGSSDAQGSNTATGGGTHCGTRVRDPRSPANRRAHALIAALRGFLDAGTGPTQGGERPHITMVMHWDVIKGALTSAGYDSGGAITAAQARKFLCDAQIIPAILDSNSEVLDIGRERRTFPLAIRRAITLRDGGCIWPGCDRPPGWCDCHHVEWWHRDGGDTCYKGGVLFCPCHHTEIHKGEWVVQMGADGIPELIPPKWIDSEQKPLRNNMHRPMGLER